MDQELKVSIYQKVKDLMQPYTKTLEVRGQKEHQFNLYGTKEVQLAHKVESGMYFASVMINKGFVGFYFFPIYTHPQAFKDLDALLMKCLKGKSCFHLKKDDPELYNAISKALEKGYKHYQELGYI